jgi:TetR/AcrR family transcriptional regulator, lmrAB and yxaGH operons repressor
VSDGVPEARADSLATVSFATLEGAIVFARAERSTEPIDRVLPELRALLDSALA